MASDKKSDIEIFGYGITRHHIDDGAIAVVTTEGNMLNDAIDTWADTLIDTMQMWSASQPIAVLHNLSHPAQGLTPYARQRSIDLMNHIPEGAMVYSAMIVPPTFMNRILKIFIRIPQFQEDNHHLRIFTAESPALEWLRSQVKTYKTSA